MTKRDAWIEEHWRWALTSFGYEIWGVNEKELCEENNLNID